VLAAPGSAFPDIPNFSPPSPAPRAVMMLASDKLRVVPLVIHVPWHGCPAWSQPKGSRKRGDHSGGVEAGFWDCTAAPGGGGAQPHAGEDGVLGGEEEAIIAPRSRR